MKPTIEEVELAVKTLGNFLLWVEPESRIVDGIPSGDKPIWHQRAEINGKKYKVDAKLYEGLAIMKMVHGEYFGKTKWFTEMKR